MFTPNKAVVTDTFIHPCLACGRTVTVEAGKTQPHDCSGGKVSTERAELVARAWWAGYEAASTAR